jgi:cholest-4-en-3-one 26-monooxygenase
VIGAFEKRFRDLSTAVLDKALAERQVDFVHSVAVPMPLHAICDLMGIPDDDRQDVLRWSNAFFVATDPDYAPSPEEVFAAVGNLWAYGVTLAEKRRRAPGEDLMSQVAAAFESEQLSEDELMGMTFLLAAGGTETTRNALSDGLHALLRNPDQMAFLREHGDRVLDTAVEEILRYSSPVINTRRTAAQRVVLHGQIIEPGDRVAIMYTSANFDPEMFPDPERFELTRSPNPHVAFGSGRHVCLGAAVARLEIRVALQQLLTRTTDIKQLGAIEYVRDSFLRGVKRLPVELVPAA